MDTELLGKGLPGGATMAVAVVDWFGRVDAGLVLGPGARASSRVFAVSARGDRHARRVLKATQTRLGRTEAN